MRELSDCDEIIEAIDELPPSAKLVIKVLEYNGRLTYDQLHEKTHLPDRTIYDAIIRLQNLGALIVESADTDTKQSVYSITDDFPECLSSSEESTR